MKVRRFEPIPDELNGLATQAVDAAVTVHRVLGPGLLEHVYEVCLAHELRSRGLQVECQAMLPVYFDGIRLDAGMRLDIVVEHSLILELKAVEKLLPVHTAQLLSYLRLTNRRLGLLLNFYVPVMHEGIKRVVN